MGGPKEATIKIEGPRVDLKNILTTWLRYEVEIQTEKGTPCWWGIIHEVELDLDGLIITASLDNLRNRIAVTYSSLEGTAEQGIITDWDQNDASVASFGIKEHFESLGSASQSMALNLQATMLSHFATPKLKRALGSPGKAAATLKCRGWIDTTSWLYYQRTAGRIEHMQGSSKIFPIGWGILADSDIGFGGYGIHDVSGRLAVLPAGVDIGVSGSSLNNIVYPIAETVTGEVEIFETDTIWFEASDDMLETWGNMTMIESNHWVLVEGSAANSRWHFTGTVAPDHVQFSASVSGTVTAEAVGQDISLTQAQKLPTNARGDYEAPGTVSTVNLTLHGYRIAQRFYSTDSMRVDKLFLEVSKNGTPADSLRVAIYSDSAGTVGSSLTSGTKNAADITYNSTGLWIEFTPYTLAAGTYYWIVVDRTSTVNGSDHYLVSMSDQASLTCLSWTGADWVGHKPGWYLKYRLWAVEDTGTMIETILADRIQFLTLSRGYTSGVYGFSTMDQIAVVKDEVLRLLAIGTSTGLRIQLLVGPDKTIRLRTQPGTPTTHDTLHLSTRDKVLLTDAVGTEWPKGLLPYGMYVALIDLDTDLQVEQGLSPALATEVEYDAEDEAWSISFGGERSLADILKIQQG